VGFNYRLDEPRAALALSRLPRLAGDIESRRELARTYRSRLAGLDGLELVWSDEDVEHASHFAFPVVLPDEPTRDRFRERLSDLGVQTTWYPAVHRFTDYVENFGEVSLPNVEAAAQRHCALPMSAHLSQEEIDIVVESVEEALSDLPDAAAA
jgi:dTDP-4-amino-4,6-dideoxygalactose transaminase